ncbi:hypothetical protein [uncultured Sphingomonas sp.]|uniref:hypothetical protein n=1 Tax=uncultured Sphingomonas sp. TaxID=158754 RepID=UPI0035CB0EA0
MLGAFAEFERTMNGLSHARKAGRYLGRKPSLTAPQRAEIIAKAESGQGCPVQLANLFRVSRSTVQRVLREYCARQEASLASVGSAAPGSRHDA